MTYVTAVSYDGKHAYTNNGKVVKYVYECKNIQEALNVEINLDAEGIQKYIKVYENKPEFQLDYEFHNRNISTHPMYYERIEDMNLDGIDDY